MLSLWVTVGDDLQNTIYFCRMIATDKTVGIYKIFAKDRYHALMMPCLSCDLQVGPILNDRIVNNQASTYGSINLTCLTPKIWLFIKHVIINLQEIVLKHICPTDSLTRPKPSGLGIYQALITASWALIAVTLSVIFFKGFLQQILLPTSVNPFSHYIKFVPDYPSWCNLVN